jgi:(p)ppGpp synthase/HD superfamily hydrolase
MENTDEGHDQLEGEFGPDIADLVVALTKNMMLPSKSREKDYEDRLAKANWRARLVKLADEYDNLTDTLTGQKDGNGEERKKAKRIIALAESDAEKHPETKRAIDALSRLLKVKKRR